jgi:hypothetical protein
MNRSNRVSKLPLLVALVAAVAAAGAPAAQATDAPFPMNPWPAANVAYAWDVITLTSSGGKVRPVTGVCVQQSVFRRGNQVIFQAVTTRSKDGKVMNGRDFGRMVVRIPGQQEIVMTFRPLGGRPDATSPWVWVGVWNVPDDFPLGSMSYEVVAVTKRTKTQPRGGQTVNFKPRITLTITP